jgi:hypothetical protein
MSMVKRFDYRHLARPPRGGRQSQRWPSSLTIFIGDTTLAFLFEGYRQARSTRPADLRQSVGRASSAILGHYAERGAFHALQFELCNRSVATRPIAPGAKPRR